MGKRRATRHSVTLFVGGTPMDPKGEAAVPFGRTCDVSRSGLRLVTEARPPVGEHRRISIVWGDELLGCETVVARHTDDGLALVFETPDPGFTAALDEILGYDAELVPPIPD